MQRKRLELSDIAGKVLDSYEGKYQELLNNYKSEKLQCSQYKDDIKKSKGLELNNKYLSKVNELKSKMDNELMNIAENKKNELIAAQEEKNKPLDLNKAFPSTQSFMTSKEEYNNQMQAFQYMYKAIANNSNLLMANSLLKSGDAKAIGNFLEKNIDNNDLVNVIEANLKVAKDTKYSNILQNISDSKITEVDDLDAILKNLRFGANDNTKMRTGMSLNRAHNINKDFNVDDLIYENGNPVSQFFLS